MMGIDSFVRSFVRAWGWGLGKQAARRTGWVLVPVLVVVVVLGWLGMLPDVVTQYLPLSAIPTAIPASLPLPLIGGWLSL
jgi:hypothetical protein